MKILMALMGMEIGGAETHVLELATDLKNKGYDVIVTSNGGVYVKELEDVGIKHIKLPLHTKKPSAMIKSFFGLKKIIKEEKPDIVHTHASMSARIAARLSGCKVVYTRHSVFPPEKSISQGIGKVVNGIVNNFFSDRIIAVAQAAKED